MQAERSKGLGSDACELTSFMRDRKPEILARWAEVVREQPAARDLARPELLDHIPELFDHIKLMCEELVAGGTPRRSSAVAGVHASTRLEEGFDLGAVVFELTALRDCILRLWFESGETVRPRWRPIDAQYLRALDQAIDAAIGASIERYTETRARLLVSLERARTAVDTAQAQERAAGIEAERSLAFLDTVLSSTALGIAYLDNELRFVRINDALAGICGRPPADHIGHTIRAMYGDIANEFEPVLRRVLETRRPEVEVEVEVSSDVPGGTRSFLASYVPVVTPRDELLGVGVVAVEITERKRDELALRASEAEAQRSARLREKILALVSHDLRNPLGAIHMASALLLEDADPRIRKHLETIHRASTRMDHMIGDLLDMASIQAGRLSIARSPEAADALLREVAEAHEQIARAREITFVREAALAGVEVSCDRHRVLQVFGNLIGNAIKFCRPGDTITLRGERLGSEVRFAIVDTGPGIAGDQVGYIFEPYWSAKEHAAKGTGLGLFISKGIIEAHGGRLWVESTLGEGSTFYFTLPVA